MVVRNISAIAVRIVMFSALLILLALSPRFCASAPEPESIVSTPEPAPPSPGPMEGGMLQKMTPTVISTSESTPFTPKDRQQIELEAKALEWDLCQEKKPSADLCQVNYVQVSPTSDGRAMARIYLEYHYSHWDSSRSKTLTVDRFFEPFSDGWILSE